MRLLFLIVATFAVGLLAGSLLWTAPAPRSDRASVPAGTAARTVVVGDGPSAEGAAARAERASSGVATPDVQLRALVGEAAAEVERIQAGGAVEFQGGEGVITGTVRDPSGAPVAGATVTALPDSRPAELASARRAAARTPHRDRDLGDVTREAIETELWRRQARRVARSAADGTFRLAGLATAQQRLTGYHEEYDLTPVARANRVQPDAVVDFLARPVAEVRVEVLLPDGALAERAWIRWTGPNGGGGSEWTREPGTLRMETGACRVSASTSEPTMLEAKESEFIVRRDAPGDVLRLQLVARRLLVARVALPTGLAMPRNLAFRLRRLVSGEEVDAASLIRERSQRQPQKPAPGEARWFDLEPGRYLVAAFTGNRWLFAQGEVEVGEAPVEVALEAEESLDSGQAITVRLVAPAGGPIAGGASFAVIAGPKDRRRHHAVRALQRADGTWLLYPDGIDAKQAADPVLRASAWRHGTVVQPIALRGGGTVTVRFESPAQLRIRVEGYGSSGVEGDLSAFLRAESGADVRRSVAPDGSADFGGVQPGDYRIQLVVRRRSEQWTLLSRPLRLRAGDAEETIALPVLHTLRVRWAKRPRGDAILRASDEALRPCRRRVRYRQHLSVFESLAAGTYEVQSGRQRVSVRVPGPTEVVVE